MLKSDTIHRGRIGQIPIYTGKFFRMFIFMDDWKVLPMAIIISGLVSVVACSNMFKTMEGTLTGSLALVCVCIWNGFFNSVQAVCRERNVVKREHRAGLHISSYIAAHMIYQGFLCFVQTAIMIVICRLTRMSFPEKGLITPWFELEIGITFFLITYAADMMSLFISCIVKNTTAAMTVMPFMLIVQLVFSGSLFTLSDGADKFTGLTISKWGLNCLCAQADYNSQPMVSVWNQLFKFREFQIQGMQPIKTLVDYMLDNDMVQQFCFITGSYSQKADYAATAANVLSCWLHLAGFVVLFAALAVLVLERIDKDKR